MGPLIGGFIAQYLGWLWANWMVMLFAGVGLVLCALIRETYAPVLLKKMALTRRKETVDERL
jgi:MFS family permease